MPSPYNLEIQNNCVDCVRKVERMFCNMSAATMHTLDAIKFVKSLFEETMTSDVFT